VLFREALDDVVILVPGTDVEPFALAGGAALWRLLAEPRTTSELWSVLTEGLAINQAETDLDGLLGRLADSGAIERKTA
jgi:hypothetical protein